MSTASGPNGARHPASADQLREQIAEDRRALAETITALHDKTDVKGRIHDKTAGAEMAAADLAGWVGRKAVTVPRLAKHATSTAAEQVRDKVPQPVRMPVEQAAAMARRQSRLVLAGLAAMVAAMVVVMRRRGR